MRLLLLILLLILVPGLCDVLVDSGAVDHLHVPNADFRITNGHEVGSRAADGEFGEVGERLADGPSEQEGAHHLIKGSHVLVEVRIGVNPLTVNQIGFSGGNLRNGKQLKTEKTFFIAFHASVE